MYFDELYQPYASNRYCITAKNGMAATGSNLASAAGLEVLTGEEHKATFKTVFSSRIDTAALKKGHPDIAAQYTKTTETKRFTFA